MCAPLCLASGHLLGWSMVALTVVIACLVTWWLAHKGAAFLALYPRLWRWFLIYCCASVVLSLEALIVTEVVRVVLSTSTMGLPVLEVALYATFGPVLAVVIPVLVAVMIMISTPVIVYRLLQLYAFKKPSRQ